MARVMGIDPGIGRTGVSVVDGSVGHLSLVWSGCIDTATSLPDSERLSEIYSTVHRLVAEHRPTVVSIERLFFAKNQTTAIRAAQGRGAALAAAGAHGIQVAEYTPMEIKETISGWGGASKAQLERMVAMMLHVDRIEGPDDVSDACAIAICHHHRGNLLTKIDAARGKIIGAKVHTTSTLSHPDAIVRGRS